MYRLLRSISPTANTTPWWLSLLLLLFVGLPAKAVDDPDGVQFTLSGCRQEAGAVIPSGDPLVAPLCEDGAYTTGNLGKMWAELDLVPHRLKVSKQNNDPSQTYRVVVSGDNILSSGLVGWDRITVPVLNPNSDAGCAIAGVGPISTASGSVGGVDQIVYRYIDITHPSGATCIVDYAQRLSITSAGFSGSSLQSQFLKQNLDSIGQRTLSIPVADILPQEISKVMTATQDIDNDWNITKSVTPVSFSFGDTCSPEAVLSKDVNVTVTWTKTPTLGGVHVQTIITANNPSSRDVLIKVTDTIKAGASVIDVVNTSIMTGLNPDAGGFVLLPANTSMPVLEHSFDAASDVTDLNDIAVAEYKDPIFNDVSIPTEDDTATASATIEVGDTLNATASIKDTEVISGAGLSFSVEPVMFGSFNGYTPENKATQVVWESGPVSSSGSITFYKTVYLDGPAIITDGLLKDTAVLSPIDSATRSASANTTITADATVELTIKKSLSADILQGGESVTFYFDATGPESPSASIQFNAGDTEKETTLTGLKPGQYSVSEQFIAGFNIEDPVSVDLNLPNCSATVTFENTPRTASAKVKKLTLPEGNEAGWSFTLYQDGNAIEGPLMTDANGDVLFSSTLGEGSYEVKEVLQDGWKLTDVIDPRNDNGDSNCTFVIDLPADADEVFTCTFENTQDGKIIVEKQTLPDGDEQLFAFEGDLAGNISDGLTLEMSVAPGVYTSTELDNLDNWDLVSISCNDNNSEGSLENRTATFNVEAGETVKCVFTNRKDGEIIIRKQVEGQSGLDLAGTFTFTGDNGLSFGPLVTANDMTLVAHPAVPVTPGFYNVAEDDPSNQLFAFKEAYCDDNNSGQNGVRNASINVEPGETVTCTFVNTKQAAPGRVVIEKITIGGTDTFGYDFDLGGFSLTTLSENTKVDEAFEGVEAGVYNIQEQDPTPEYDLIALTCVDDKEIDENTTSWSLNDRSAVISVDDGETVTCTFTNRKRARIIVEKFAAPSDTGQDFEFDASYLDANFFLKHGENNTSGWLVPATYSVGELTPEGWDLTSATCNNNDSPDSIQLNSGDVVTCTFKNVQRAQIKLVKEIEGSSNTFDFTHDIAGLDTMLTPADNSSASDLSDLLKPGSYSIAEVAEAGWDLVSASCDDNDGNDPASIQLDPGELVTCTFKNVQRGMVDVVKTLAGSPLGDGDVFTFDIRLGDGLGGAIATATAAGPLGIGESVDFSCTAEGPYCTTVDGMAKLPILNGGNPVQYAFCETGMNPGWQNVEVDEFGTPLVPQNWFVPGGGDPEADNSTECIAFTLMAGETTRFYIDDVPPPGGDARTIGYWKNWTSCDGRGNQDPVMDQNLPITLYSGFSIGTSLLGEAPDDQCAIAVDLLDKRHIGDPDLVRDSDKRANDAAYGLAAQYVAYLLNQNAGAGTCAAASSAAMQAAVLLDSINFDGTGSYLPSGKKDSDLNMSPKDYKALQSLARDLAGTLDSYNNNELCF